MRRVLRSSLVPAIILFILGQTVLLLLTPLSRAADPLGGPSGVALLAADSDLYLGRSESVEGILRSPWTRWLYLWLLHIGHLLGDAPLFIVIVQSVAAIAAGTLLHHLACTLAGPVAGWASAAVLLLNPMTAQWTRFVLTEQLMYCLIVLALWSAWWMSSRPGRTLPVIVLLTSGVLATFLRPNGILVLGSVVTLVVLHRTRGARRIGLTVITWGAVVVGLLLALSATGQPAEAPFTRQLYEGVVIEGSERVRTIIPMPPPQDLSDESNGAAVRFALRHPVATTRLALARVTAELVQVRSHYPLVVNVAFGVSMLALFSAAAVGLRTAASSALRRPTLVLSLPLIVLSGLTFASPEGRYGWTFLALLAPLAGLGVARAIRASERLT